MSQSRGLPDLPNSSDEYWQVGESASDKNLIDKNQLIPHICKKGEHKIVVDYGKREVSCLRCGYGFRFRIDKVTLKDGILCDLNGEPLY